MTTVAYRDGILAVDRIITIGDMFQYSDAKIRAFPKLKCAIAVSGYASLGHSFMNWYEESKGGTLELELPCDPFIDRPSFAALVITKHAASRTKKPFSVEVWHSRTPVPLDNVSYHAEGVGRELAMGAMWAGASAIDAVKAGNALCTCSGGGVIYVDLKKSFKLNYVVEEA